MTKKVTESELTEMLHKGVVVFQYLKKDGSVRQAKGTLLPSMITRKSSGGENHAKAQGYVTYFDLEKDNFRNFAPSRLIGVVEGE